MSDETKKTKKLSRRKKAKAKKTLNVAVEKVIKEVENDRMFRNYLLTSKTKDNVLSTGTYIVVRSGSLFEIRLKATSEVLYSGINTFDAAMAIAEALNAEYTRYIPIILAADDRVATNYREMQFFKLSYNTAIEKKTGNAAVFEDRYLVVKDRANSALAEIKRFRIVRK